MTVKFKLTFLLFLGMGVNAFAQKVANYSIGKFGTASYEHFAFWAQGSKPTRVTYAYGADNNELKATYNGVTTYQGKRAIKLTLPGNYVMYVMQAGEGLKVVGPAKKYSKLFAWEYEGPVDGRGTYCTVCAQDEKEAMQLIKSAYLK